MEKRLRLSILLIVLLLAFGCSGIKVGSRLQYAIDASNQLSQTQPAPERDVPVDHHGADIIRFVDNRRLLLGAVTFDVAGKPEYGPVILYDTEGMVEKWRIPRERRYAARHQFVAFNPNLILRTAFEGQIVHTAYERTSGNRLWSHTVDAKSIQAYRFASLFERNTL